MTEIKGILGEAAANALNICHESFDEIESMLTDRLNQKGYHSAIHSSTVHPTFRSIEYAAALLYGAAPEHPGRAESIIRKVLSLQDTDINSPTYGIWPYYLEEPLSVMKAPDWNWADFIGKILVHLLMDHRGQLPEDLLKQVESSLYHAASSIKRRNIGPDYTNINLMGAFVTIKAGELFKNEGLFNYGKNRLLKELEYVRQNGGFTEYNSPTYTLVALDELGRMMKFFDDKECLAAAAEFNEMEWGCIANHFHPATGQLSGPHSRCYDNISGKFLLSFIRVGTGSMQDLPGGRDLQVGLLWEHIVIQCPEKYHSYFKHLAGPRLFREKFYKGMDIISDDEIRVFIEKGTPEMEATTYMNGTYTLGTFAKSDLWNQRRPLLAYWGSAAECAYLKLRCLHDGQDYCSAILSTTQSDNHVIGGAYFVKDHGDFHFILDPLKDGRITAERLSFRFEIGGYTDDVILPSEVSIGSPFRIRTSKVDIEIAPMYCVFDGKPARIETGASGTVCWVDFVLYDGDGKALDFNNITEAAFLFGLSIFDREACTNHGIKRTYTLDREKGLAWAELTDAKLAGTWSAGIEIPLLPTNYMNHVAVGQVKKFRCGGFVYEQEGEMNGKTEMNGKAEK